MGDELIRRRLLRRSQMKAQPPRMDGSIQAALNDLDTVVALVGDVEAEVRAMRTVPMDLLACVERLAQIAHDTVVAAMVVQDRSKR